MEKKNIFYSFIDYVKKHKYDYVTTAMDIVLFASTKLLKKKLSKKYMVNQKSLNENGFNQYWGGLLFNMVDELNEKQMNILIHKFGLDKNHFLFENYESETKTSEEILVDGLIDVYTSETNFVVFDNGKKLIRFDVKFNGVDDLKLALSHHAKITTNINDFINSVRIFLGELSEFDIEVLINQYQKYYDNSMVITNELLADVISNNNIKNH